MARTIVRRREHRTSFTIAMTALAIFALGCGDGLLAPTESLRAPGALAVGVDPNTGARIETDQDDYAPGETVRITGSGWAANEVVELFVTESPPMHPDWTFSVTANASGGFVHTGLVMDDLHLGVTFNLTATGGSSGSVAQTTFTDSNSDITAFTLTPSGNVAPGANLVWSASAKCTTQNGSNSCENHGTTFNGPVVNDYTIILRRAVGTCATALDAAFSNVDTQTTTGTPPSGTAGGTVTAPAAAGTYAYRVRHPEQKIGPDEDNWPTANFAVCHEITVQAPPTNQPPVAEAGGPYPGTTNTPIALNGAGSTDSDGTIADPAGYVWAILGGAPCSFVNNPGKTPSVTCTNNGAFQVSLTVTDDDGATDADTATVNVGNQPPVANAGGPYANAAYLTNSPIALNGSGSDTDGTIADPAGYVWTVLGGAPCSFANNPGTTPSINCTNNGVFQVVLTVTDDDGASDADTTTVTVLNRPPVANAGGPYADPTYLTNFNIPLSGSGTDPDGTIADPAGYVWAILGGAPCSFANNPGKTPSINCTNNGVFQVVLTVTDDDGASDADTTTVTVLNRPPVAAAGGPYSGVEGANIALSGSGTDPDGTIADPAGYAWAILGGAPCSFVGGTSTGKTPSVTCTDNAAYKVSLTVTDDDGATDADTATVNVSNANPSVTINSPAAFSVWSITGFAGVPSFIDASFTDAGTSDTHACTVNWGDGEAAVAGTVSETNGAGSCKLTPGTNPYIDLGDGAGIYTITVTVTDDDGGSGSAQVTIIVFDPSAGFVTGGGWINSPAGAYKPNLSLVGKAHFGFVSKYLKGAIKPSGNTEFQFQAGGLNFHSSDYEWLIVNQAGTNAQYKGVGTINGQGSYKFMLWAADGSPDTFRIRIWSESGGVETDIYDNGVEQPLGSGSIQIHTGGKK